MQKQKRGFWLFIFSLIPGAGEMYMGFKKQGISIMLLFWGVFAVGSCTGMDWLIFLIPIIWFYSFFNVHNLKSLSEEEFYSVEDSYVLHMDKLIGDVDTLLTHHRKLTAIVLIVFGASILWNNLVDFDIETDFQNKDKLCERTAAAIVKIFEDDDRLKKFHENSYMIAEEYKEHVIESKWMQLIKNILDLNPSNLIL